jgi:pimeloyl-ACP methyl ester carboxylesterase
LQQKACFTPAPDNSIERDYRETLAAWRQIECGNPAAVPEYREGLAKLLMAANRSGCLNPRGCLTITTAQGPLTISVCHHGFAWRPADFTRVIPASEFQRGELEHHYYVPGLGVSLVAVRQTCSEETYFRERQPFAVTAVLRPAEGGAVLDFYNPLVVGTVPVGPCAVPLDRDLSAPFLYLQAEAPKKYIEGFLDPGEIGVKPKLILMEPYQPGKIPVVFIHGLGSDPLTFADAINRLRIHSDIYGRFQFWFFRYPTGGDLLQSAAALREKLLIARDTFDPQHCDPALEQMVLVGHSLGGLVAQLQVSYSYDLLWQEAAKRPLEAVRAPPKVLNLLRASFYFDPSPLVKRVVFMATPHHGSSMARRVVGRAASKFVNYSPEEDSQYRQLMDCNHDVFREELWKKKPTAIELLEPNNPLLAAMTRMPIGRCVRWHSIIGDCLCTLDGDGSDGVVPVESARLRGASSEKYVFAKHVQVNKVDEAVDELARILREHAMSAAAAQDQTMTMIQPKDGHL